MGGTFERDAECFGLDSTATNITETDNGKSNSSIDTTDYKLKCLVIHARNFERKHG